MLLGGSTTGGNRFVRALADRPAAYGVIASTVVSEPKESMPPSA